MDVAVALIGVFGAIAVALIEKDRRDSKKRWNENKEDHNAVMDEIKRTAKGLGRSIDRVEETALRTETKIDQHIRDHAVGNLDK